MFEKEQEEKTGIITSVNKVAEVDASHIFGSKSYSDNLNAQKENIKTKILNMNNKISTLNTQSSFVEKNIKNKQVFLENMDQGNFTAIRKIENAIVFQMDINSKIHDNIIKYEGLIQSYTKYLLDIENNRLNGYIKIGQLNKESETTNKEFMKMSKEIHKLISGGSGGNAHPSSEEDKNGNLIKNLRGPDAIAAIHDQALQELQGSGYKASLKK